MCTWIYLSEPELFALFRLSSIPYSTSLHHDLHIRKVVTDQCCFLWAKRRVLIADSGMLSVPQNSSLSHIRDITVCPTDGFQQTSLTGDIGSNSSAVKSGINTVSNTVAM